MRWLGGTTCGSLRMDNRGNTRGSDQAYSHNTRNTWSPKTHDLDGCNCWLFLQHNVLNGSWRILGASWAVPIFWLRKSCRNITIKVIWRKVRVVILFQWNSISSTDPSWLFTLGSLTLGFPNSPCSDCQSLNLFYFFFWGVLVKGQKCSQGGVVLELVSCLGEASKKTSQELRICPMGKVSFI